VDRSPKARCSDCRDCRDSGSNTAILGFETVRVKRSAATARTWRSPHARRMGPAAACHTPLSSPGKLRRRSEEATPLGSNGRELRPKRRPALSHRLDAAHQPPPSSQPTQLPNQQLCVHPQWQPASQAAEGLAQLAIDSQASALELDFSDCASSDCDSEQEACLRQALRPGRLMPVQQRNSAPERQGAPVPAAPTASAAQQPARPRPGVAPRLLRLQYAGMEDEDESEDGSEEEAGQEEPSPAAVHPVRSHAAAGLASTAHQPDDASARPPQHAQHNQPHAAAASEAPNAAQPGVASAQQLQEQQPHFSTAEECDPASWRGAPDVYVVSVPC
jgi:hypothetical protein